MSVILHLHFDKNSFVLYVSLVQNKVNNGIIWTIQSFAEISFCEYSKISQGETSKKQKRCSQTFKKNKGNIEPTGILLSKTENFTDILYFNSKTLILLSLNICIKLVTSQGRALWQRVVQRCNLLVSGCNTVQTNE